MKLDKKTTGNSTYPISRRTGFSETTVRRRVKLIELDGKKFKEAVERGATLMDFIELEKIQDLKLRNKVLEKIGTSNFKWELQAAIDKEKNEANAAIIVAELEKFAKKTTDTSKLQYVRSYGASQGSTVEMPEDAETEEYFYTVSGSYFTLYKIRPQTEVNTAEAEQRKKQQERKSSLDEISKRAYQLRLDFARQVSNTKAKKSIGSIIKQSIGMLLDCSGPEAEELAALLDIEVGEDDDLEFDTFEESISAQPERLLFLATYLAMDSDGQNYHDWYGKHKDNELLDDVYSLLEELGYEMSDEEYGLMNGTHELFGSEAEK